MNSHVPNGTGVGLRLPHISEMAATPPAAGWLEIHPETFLANPHATELLIELSRHYPISLHTVGVSALDPPARLRVGVGLVFSTPTLPILGQILVIQIFVYPHAWNDHLLWASALLFILTRAVLALSRSTI
jgi:hypothetical protein